MILRDCTLCGFTHHIPWSAWCALCWGARRGEIPDEPADDGEVVGRG